MIGEGVEGFTQRGRRVHDDLLQGDHRRGARLHRGIPRDLELAHHLDGAIRGLRGRRRLARQHGPRGHLGVHCVGLSGGATRTPVSPVDFHDTMPRLAHRAGQAGAVAASAFDAERLDGPVGLGPRDQGLIATRISDERVIAKADPPGVDRHGDVDMLVRIDADNHLPRLGLGGHALGHGWPPRDAAAGWPGWADRTVTGRGWQAPIGSRPIRSAGCRTLRRWATTDRSIARTVGQSGCGSGHHAPAPIDITKRPRQAWE